MSDSLKDGLKAAHRAVTRMSESVRLFDFIERCHKAGVITDRQRQSLEGAVPWHKPQEILRKLCCKR